MATEKSILNGLKGHKPPSDGSLNFDVELQGLKEAEAQMARLQAKVETFNTQLRQSSTEKLLQDQLVLLAEKSKGAGAHELCELSAAMVSVQECLRGVQKDAG